MWNYWFSIVFRWDVHEFEPGRDFYNWTKRCESAGDQFNPFGVGAGRQYERHCNPENPLRCAAGDLTGKGSRIAISAKKENTRGIRNKIFYTEVQLPLSGPDKILGKVNCFIFRSFLINQKSRNKLIYQWIKKNKHLYYILIF